MRIVNKKINSNKAYFLAFTIVAFIALITTTYQIENKFSQVTKKQKLQIASTITPVTTPVESTSTPIVSSTDTPLNKPNRERATVTAVIDGDTIEVDLGQGNIQRVRYIGIDTPESVDPRKPIQCFSKEATAKNKELVGNGIVGLEKDVSETDKYGRLLRYVYVGDVLINHVLVAEGFANARSYPPDIKYQERLFQAEQQARTVKKGLWGSCSGETMGTTSTLPQTTVGSTGTCKYSCSSPDRDCTDFSTHEEAQTYFSCCGYSADNDPMNLDAVGVGDGIACENK